LPSVGTPLPRPLFSPHAHTRRDGTDGVPGRTINIPLLALQFIRAQNQDRSTFSDAGTKNRGGSVLRIVAFQERTEPRMIRTDDGAGASGRLWIERVSGRIVETELVVTTRVKAPGRPGIVVTAVINVAYAEQPQCGYGCRCRWTNRIVAQGSSLAAPDTRIFVSSASSPRE